MRHYTIVAIDFDGTLMREEKRSTAFTNQRLESKPMPKAREALECLDRNGCYVVVHSCRARDELGRSQILNWLSRHKRRPIKHSSYVLSQHFFQS